MKIVSYIPIKLNNERLPGKNLLPLGGKNTCDYIFSTISSVRGIDERYVFCSDESICKYIPRSINYLKRDVRLDASNVKTMEIIHSFIEVVDADIYVLTHVTSPFISVKSFETALQQVISGKRDSAFSAERVQSLCWFRERSLNYDISDIPRTQDIDPIYVETNGFYIFSKEVATEFNSRIGKNPYICEVSHIEAVDIDTAADYEFCKLIVEQQRREGKS